MSVLMWRLEHRKRTKVGEFKTTKKPISREDAIEQLLKRGGFFKDDDGSYYTKKTETITPSESELVASYDVVFEDGSLKVVPTAESPKGAEGKGTSTGLHIELQERGEYSEHIPIMIVFEKALEE